jgi:CubicO group peptidase (beta-lactamase class C family)
MDLFNSPEFASHVETLMKEHHVPGMAIAIIQDEQVASKGYGHTSPDGPKPCTVDTLFDIASCSKSLTAASVALLVENDQYPEVKWDAKMSKLLPDDFVLTSVTHLWAPPTFRQPYFRCAYTSIINFN